MGLAIIAFPVLRHQEKLSTHTLEVKQFCWLHFIIKPGKIKPSSVSVTQRLLNQKPQTRQTIIFFSVRSVEPKQSVGGWGPCPHGVYFLSASNFFSVVPVVGVQRIFFRALHIFHELVWIWILVKCSRRCCCRHNKVLCSHMLQVSTARTVLPGENIMWTRAWSDQRETFTSAAGFSLILMDPSSHLSSLQPIDEQESLISLAGSSRVVLWFN